MTFIIFLFFKLSYTFLRINDDNIKFKLNKNIFYLKYISVFFMNHKKLIILKYLISKND